MKVVAVGEVLWDVFPTREILGGAALNFCVNTVRLGGRAGLITAVANDVRGRAAKVVMEKMGVDTRLVQMVSEPPTGIAVVTTTPDGEPHFAIPRPAAFDSVESTEELLAHAAEIEPDWLYLGTLLQTNAHVEELTRTLAGALAGTRCFYDMNLRAGCWTLPLVERLCGLAHVLKLNDFEARTLGDLAGLSPQHFSLAGFCAEWASRYRIETVCVTLGSAGCMVYDDGNLVTVPGFPTDVDDTVGAGDAFSAAFLHGYHLHWPVLRSARFANAVGSVVASRAGATPAWTVKECAALAAIPVEEIYAARS